MKTLIYTSIYSNLWGTEFGGRPSRELHYKYSLLNVINLNPDKLICFTSPEEIENLKNWFFNINGISQDKLELVVFDLHKTKYFDEIKKLKNLDLIKNYDRCYEVQYNKFFWLENISNLDEYDKIYWFDAGLSHGGLFPEEYCFGDGYSKNFSFSLFNEDFLNYINNITNNNKFLVVSKNNTGKFYWSQTLPLKWYKKFNNSEHIIGGFFGGNKKVFLGVKKDFEQLLLKLLKNEKTLFHEELIMSCLYQNDNKKYFSLKFDDWYDRKLPEVYDNTTSYFYNIFEIHKKIKTCLVTVCIEITENSTRYVNSCKNLINSYLEYTDFDLLVLTNRINSFDEIEDERLILISYDDTFDEKITSSQRFNMHLKRLPIKLASKMEYDIIYFHDCDCYIVGWDKLSYEKKCNQDFDVAFVSHANPQLGGLRETYKHFQDKIDLEFGELYYDKLDESPNPAETRVIFKNNEKLCDFLNFWDKISNNNNDYFTYHDGVYFGTSSVHAGMKMTGVTPQDKFSQYCRISHSDKVLDYFGVQIINEEKLDNGVQETNNINLPYVPGTFNYKGLQILQHVDVVDSFEELLYNLKPSVIIEIGTEYGGLTLLLQDLIIDLCLNTKIITYDIKTPKFLKEHPDLTDTIEIRTKDLFKYNPFDLSVEGISEIRKTLTTNGINLILCDGARKSDEFNSFSKIINRGDVIMLHDYIIDEIEFETNFKNKIWNWHESKLSDISESIKNNNLKPYMEDKFSKVVWGCFKKNKK